MKDEIKEILEDMNYRPERAFIISADEKHLLLDYITNLQEENQILKNGYCELKVKCNNGECDCTHEEYEGMVQANIRGSLLLEDYKTRINKAIEYIKNKTKNEVAFDNDKLIDVLNILKGE